jgi:hypothetical protein
LAVGDVINGIFNNYATANYYQPSSGVEVMIVSSFGTSPNSSNFITGISNGTANTYNTCKAYPDTLVNSRFVTFNIKIGITNTRYLYLYGDQYETGYTGIQTK